MIELREVRAEDKEMIRSWRNRPHVARHMYTSHRIGPEEHDLWFRGIFDDPRRRFWIVLHRGRDVGLVNLYDIDEANRRCSWAFYLADEEVRLKGLGSFVEYRVLEHVFFEMGFNKLCCEVLATNGPVVEMHKRFGFRREGYHREHVIKDGRPENVVSMAILKAEWQSVRPEMERRLSQIEAQLKERGYLEPEGVAEKG